MTTPNADANGAGTNGSGAAGQGAAGQGAAGEGEEIKDWADVKKAFAKRDELKGEVKDLRTLVEGIGQKLDQIAKPPAGQQQQQGQPAAGQGAPPAGQQAAPPAGGEPPKPGSLEETVANLAKIVTGLATDKADVLKAGRRKTVEDTVIAAAKPESKELVRGALAMLALDGHVDLHADDSAAQVDKALTKLRAANPGHFAAAQGSAPAPNGDQNIIPPNAQPHELTAEQLNRLSDEDFKKLRKATRTSGLAV